ncbi:UNVERIFIED_CONTAM: hypothetical protein HDU68_002337 [Siphonaria sp. JEL0065]|nr:hypothetical protein HDU68_002337 [Siphonaria sp. JEL0065]
MEKLLSHMQYLTETHRAASETLYTVNLETNVFRDELEEMRLLVKSQNHSIRRMMEALMTNVNRDSVASTFSEDSTAASLVVSSRGDSGCLVSTPTPVSCGSFAGLPLTSNSSQSVESVASSSCGGKHVVEDGGGHASDDGLFNGDENDDDADSEGGNERTDLRFSDFRGIPTPPTSTFPQRRALIVDDDAIYRKIVSAYLTRLNFTCDTASTGLEAVQKVLHPTDPDNIHDIRSPELQNGSPPPASNSRAGTPELTGSSVRDGSSPPATPATSSHYHLVIMDIMLPSLNGLQATRQIKQFYPDILIIALTCVNIQEQDRGTYHDVGMQDILTKPLKFGTLVDCLDEYFGVREFLMSLPGVPRGAFGNGGENGGGPVAATPAADDVEG